MKTQAETAARIVQTGAVSLKRGAVIPDFELLFGDGTRQLLSQFRSRSNLVIIFSAEPEARKLLAELTKQNSALEINEAKVLVVGLDQYSDLAARPQTFAGAAAPNLPKMLAGTQMLITDRFGEIFAVFPNAQTPSIPSAYEVVRWLEFINQQCEECSPPEWQE